MIKFIAILSVVATVIVPIVHACDGKILLVAAKWAN